jgi:hypothetical protein
VSHDSIRGMEEIIFFILFCWNDHFDWEAPGKLGLRFFLLGKERKFEGRRVFEVFLSRDSAVLSFFLSFFLPFFLSFCRSFFLLAPSHKLSVSGAALSPIRS